MNICSDKNLWKMKVFPLDVNVRVKLFYQAKERYIKEESEIYIRVLNDKITTNRLQRYKLEFFKRLASTVNMSLYGIKYDKEFEDELTFQVYFIVDEHQKSSNKNKRKLEDTDEEISKIQRFDE